MRFGNGDLANRLALVQHKLRPIERTGQTVGRPGHRAISTARHEDPNASAGPAHAASGRFGHARQHLVDGQRLGHAPGELGQHLIRAGAMAVHDPVRQALHPLPHRLEGDRDRRGGQNRQSQARLATGADQRAHAHNQRDVYRSDQRRQRAVHQRAVDDQVDVV